MKRNTVYKINKIGAGAFGFGEGNFGLVLKNQTHPKNNHGLLKKDFGIYVKKSNGEIWKLNGEFKDIRVIDKLSFYINSFNYKVIKLIKFLKNNW